MIVSVEAQELERIFLEDAAIRARMFSELNRVLQELWFPASWSHSRASTQDLATALSGFDFRSPRDFEGVFRDVVKMLRSFDVATTRPGYLGLFNPHPTFASVVAETLVSIFSCQLGSRSHCEAGVEIERFLVRYFARRIGYKETDADGAFTSGTSEAHTTILPAALLKRWPDAMTVGLRGLAATPIVYASSETHHSLHKALRVAGLGDDALREIPVDREFRIRVWDLRRAIDQDRQNGHTPWLVVGNCGTTSSGAFDPIDDLATVCREHALWLHVDAAWAGGAILSPAHQGYLAPLKHADSITIDAHKWLSMPPACGIVLLRHPHLLQQCYQTKGTYMPSSALEPDPFEGSIAWTRRFNGLKLFMTLAAVGQEGYQQMIEHQIAVAEHLREGLSTAGWRIVNASPFPIVCFQQPSSVGPQVSTVDFHKRILTSIQHGGEFWFSSVVLPGVGFCLRACITNFRTSASDVDILLQRLAEARDALLQEL